MSNKLFEIECSEKIINPFFGNNRINLKVYRDKLIFKKINSKMQIPREIRLTNISNIKLKFNWKLQLRIEVYYKLNNKIKKLSFVTGNVVDKVMYVSTPLRTYKLFKIINDSWRKSI